MSCNILTIDEIKELFKNIDCEYYISDSLKTNTIIFDSYEDLKKYFNKKIFVISKIIKNSNYTVYFKMLE